MAEGVVVVKEADNVFGIRAKSVRTIVEVSEENFKKTAFLSRYSVGGVIYHGNLYPLISVRRLMGGEENPNVSGKIAVIVSEGDRSCALLVDEVVTIEVAERVEIDKGETNVFKLKQGFAEEFNLELLQRFNVPFLRLRKSEDRREVRKREKRRFVVVSVDGKRFSIDASLIRKVMVASEQQEVRISGKGWINEAFSIDGRVVKTGILGRVFGFGEAKGEYLVVLEKDRKRFALLVSDIEDIVEVSTDEITSAAGAGEDYVEGFLNLPSGIVPIVSSEFLEKSLSEFSSEVAVETKRGEKKKRNFYLVFFVGEGRFGVPLVEVKKLVSAESVKVYTFGAKNTAGVVQDGKDIHPIVAFEGAENLTSSDYLIVGRGKRTLAVPITEVEGISEANVSKSITATGGNVPLKEAFIDSGGEVVNVIDVEKLTEGVYGPKADEGGTSETV